MTTPDSIAIGQVWREVDPRKQRFVRVHAIGTVQPKITTVEKVGDEWKVAYRGRSSYVDPGRFNGKRGGYEYVETDARFALHFGEPRTIPIVR